MFPVVQIAIGHKGYKQLYENRLMHCTCSKWGDIVDRQDRVVITEEEEAMILEQIKYLHAERVSIQQGFLAVISVSVGAYALVLYYAFMTQGSARRIFLILPFLFLLSIFNIIKYTSRMLGLSAYSRYLEELVNVKHEKILFAWHGYLIHANGSSLFGVVPQIPSFIALILVLGYQFDATIRELEISANIASALMILFAVQSILMVVMLYFCGKQYKAVLEICQDLSKRKPGEKGKRPFSWKDHIFHPKKKNPANSDR